MSTMRPERNEAGFGLVAAMFLIIIVALVIAAMARLAVTQNATTSLAIQQARAYQAARAGIEYGIVRVLAGQGCASFALDGFQVAVTCTPSAAVDITEEDRLAVQFFSITARAEHGQPGNPDYAYREITSVVERP